MKEENTYTLIPNGVKVNNDQGPGSVVNAYLIQHDQTGMTIPWRGKSLKRYNVDTAPEEFHPLLFSNLKRWKVKEFKRMKRKTLLKEDVVKAVHSLSRYPALKKECEVTPIYIGKPMALNDYEDDYEDEGDFDLCDCGVCHIARSNLKETNMITSSNLVVTNNPDTTQKQRAYLLDRLSETVHVKRNELREHFKLDPTKVPDTIKELVQKIKDGDFSYDEKYFEKKFLFPSDMMVQAIRWSKDKADEKGFNEASDALREARIETADVINILSPEEGLKALKAFEAQTFY